MDTEDKDVEQGKKPVKKAVGERGKSWELKGAGRKNPTTCEVIDSHRLSIAAAAGDCMADTRQNIDKEGNTDPSGR